MSSNFAHSYHSRLFGLEQSCFSLSGSAVMLSAPGDFSSFRLRTALFVRSLSFASFSLFSRMFASSSAGNCTGQSIG